MDADTREFVRSGGDVMKTVYAGLQGHSRLYGQAKTRPIAAGNILGAVDFLRATLGDRKTYEIVQAIADDIATSIAFDDLTTGRAVQIGGAK